MCGIAGIVSLNSKEVFVEKLKTMTDSLSHRGPDGEGHWVSDDGLTGFGHRRLAIIDLSEAGRQPMEYLDRYTITYNGEIYNYVELKEMCERKGYTFSTHTDTEVLMAMYDWKKEECLNFFDGMFAFALHDASEKKIFIARDRFGEKPFFYSHLPGQSFYFASEMKGLWSVGIPKKANEGMLFNYLAFNYLDNPAAATETFFENIYNLPPSHYLLLDTTTLTITTHQYWDIAYHKTDQAITLEKAADKFKELFYTSVSRRLRSDVPVGSSLSGGLDSSTVVCVIEELNKHRGNSQNTFSAIFPVFEKDESRYINQLIAGRRITPCFIIPDATLIMETEKCFFHQEEPFGSASVLVQYAVMRLAKDHHTTVLLDGQGADELLAGYHSFYTSFFTELKTIDKKMYTNEKKSYQNLYTGSRVNPIPAKNMAFYIKKWGGDYKYFLKGAQLKIRQKTNPLFTDSFYAAYKAQQFTQPAEPQTLNEALYQSMKGQMRHLLRFADRNSMAFGRETRFPFLYHELAEFLFSLPAQFKIHNGWTKYLQRVTFQELLPDIIAWRKDKIAYEPPQREWMQQEIVKTSIIHARQRLVNERILHPSVLKKRVTAEAANSQTGKSWNHLMASLVISG